MEPENEIYRICTICYRKYLPSKSTGHQVDLILFVKLLERFVCSQNAIATQLNKINNFHHFQLGCCGDCLLTVNGFCELYDKIKCLELQLEWKIHKLLNVIKLANKVSSRITEAQKINDIDSKTENQSISNLDVFKLIKSFRHQIYKQCHNKLAKARPKVIIQKYNRVCSKSSVFSETQQISNKITDQINVSDPLNCEDSTNDGQLLLTNVQAAACCENIGLLDSFTSQDNHDDNSFDDINDSIHEQITVDTESCKDICVAVDFKCETAKNSDIIHESNLSDSGNTSKNTNQICFKEEHQNPSEDECSPIDREIKDKRNQDRTRPINGVFDNAPENENSTTSLQHQTHRYSLRRKRANITLKLEDTTSDNDSTNLSSSATSESEDDTKQPLIPVRRKYCWKQKPKTTKCRICNKMVKYGKLHFKTNHDKTGVNKEGIFKCEQQNCQAYFLRVDQLKLHCAQEHNTTESKLYKRKPIFRCHFCRETFPAKRQLSLHKSLCKPITKLTSTTTEESTNPDMSTVQINKFTCNFCDNYTTNSPSNLAMHEIKHAPLITNPSNSKTYCCPRCPYKSVSQKHYILHHLRHHLKLLSKNSPGACTLCSSDKIYVENSRQHFKLQHNTDTLDRFKCDKCPAYYIKSFQLQRHKIRVHLTNCECSECGKIFTRKQSLMYHLKKNHNFDEENPELPVSCSWPECTKRFATEGEMDFHIRYYHKRFSHKVKRIRSELCPKCGKAFISKGVLNHHMKAIHMEKSYICSECGKDLGNKNRLDNHMEYHKSPDEWRFECKECGKKCAFKYKLEEHMRTHSKEKPFVCQFCGAKFGHRHNWRNHLQTKHGEEKGVEDIQVTKPKTGGFLSRKGSRKGDCILTGEKVVG